MSGVKLYTADQIDRALTFAQNVISSNLRASADMVFGDIPEASKDWVDSCVSLAEDVARDMRDAVKQVLQIDGEKHDGE